jgi:hypothetical protein
VVRAAQEREVVELGDRQPDDGQPDGERGEAGGEIVDPAEPAGDEDPERDGRERDGQDERPDPREGLARPPRQRPPRRHRDEQPRRGPDRAEDGGRGSGAEGEAARGDGVGDALHAQGGGHGDPRAGRSPSEQGDDRDRERDEHEVPEREGEVGDLGDQVPAVVDEHGAEQRLGDDGAQGAGADGGVEPDGRRAAAQPRGDQADDPGRGRDVGGEPQGVGPRRIGHVLPVGQGDVPDELAADPQRRRGGEREPRRSRRRGAATGAREDERRGREQEPAVDPRVEEALQAGAADAGAGDERVGGQQRGERSGQRPRGGCAIHGQRRRFTERHAPGKPVRRAPGRGLQGRTRRTS